MDIFWLVIIALVLVGLFLYRLESIKINHAFQLLANQYGGQVQRAIINYPKLSFTYQDLNVQISATPHENGAFTYASFYTNKFSEKCTFKITSKSKLPIILETDKNLTKQKIGLEEFEKNFVLRANNDSYLVALLTSELCDSLLVLDQHYSIEARYFKNTYSNSEDDKFRLDIHIDQVLISVKEFENLIQTTKLFISQMKKITC